MTRKERRDYTSTVPYISETFAVVIGGKLRIVQDLLNYGPATHAFYRSGTVWYLRVIDTMLRDDLYAALEFTLAHDPRTSFMSEL